MLFLLYLIYTLYNLFVYVIFYKQNSDINIFVLFAVGILIHPSSIYGIPKFHIELKSLIPKGDCCRNPRGGQKDASFYTFARGVALDCGAHHLSYRIVARVIQGSP